MESTAETNIIDHLSLSKSYLDEHVILKREEVAPEEVAVVTNPVDQDIKQDLTPPQTPQNVNDADEAAENDKDGADHIAQNEEVSFEKEAEGEGSTEGSMHPTLVKSKSASLGKRILYDDVIEYVRGNITLKTFLAYGWKHSKAFTGSEYVDVVLAALQSRSAPDQSDAAPSTAERSQAIELAQYLANEFWLVMPVAIQQKSHASEDLRKKVYWQEVLIKDDEQSLYRLSKDAISMEDFSQDTFDKFVSYVFDSEEGVKKVDGKRVYMKKVTIDDGVISKKDFSEWLSNMLGIKDAKEVDAVIDLFIQRQVFSRYGIMSYFKLKANK